MTTKEFYHTYTSEILGSMRGIDEDPLVHVFFEAYVIRGPTYDSPEGPLGERYFIDDLKITDVYTGNRGLMSTFAHRKAFAVEVRRECERHAMREIDKGIEL